MCETTNDNGTTERLDMNIPSPVSYRSFEEIKNEVVRELQFPQLYEILVFLGLSVMGKLIPKLFTVWESPIPYQESSTGDVILQLDLNYPFYEQETVPDWAVVVVCILLPIVFLGISGLCFGPSGDAHASLCTLFIAVGCSELLTDLIKLYCGRFRPNFYNMCGFDSNTKECQEGQDNNVNWHRLHDARKSFPSGHASVAFSSMLVLSLYLAGRVGIQRQPSRAAPSMNVKLHYMLAWTPMLVAFFIAASRVHDFYHHPADVVGGALIGGVCAVMAHGMWYVMTMIMPFWIIAGSILLICNGTSHMLLHSSTQVPIHLLQMGRISSCNNSYSQSPRRGFASWSFVMTIKKHSCQGGIKSNCCSKCSFWRDLYLNIQC